MYDSRGNKLSSVHHEGWQTISDQMNIAWGLKDDLSYKYKGIITSVDGTQTSRMKGKTYTISPLGELTVVDEKGVKTSSKLGVVGSTKFDNGEKIDTMSDGSTMD